jgi:hypothetical protein
METAGQTKNGNERQSAPSIAISQEPVICVEHPCIIKNLDRGIKSLGGEYAINRVSDLIHFSLSVANTTSSSKTANQDNSRSLFVLKMSCPRP